MSPWLQVKDSGKTGKGLYANRRFKKGETIFIIRGDLKSFSKKIDSSIGSRWIGIGVNKWISPFRNNALWFLNHSCSPTANRKGTKRIVAFKNIKKGDEILLDYSITEVDLNWFMKCECGERKCRKIIRSVQYLPLSVYKKYKNGLPDFLDKAWQESHS